MHLRLPRRQWGVFRVMQPDGEWINPPVLLEACWTERGAWKAHSYWWNLQQAVGYKSVLSVRRLDA